MHLMATIAIAPHDCHQASRRGDSVGVAAGDSEMEMQERTDAVDALERAAMPQSSSMSKGLIDSAGPNPSDTPVLGAAPDLDTMRTRRQSRTPILLSRLRCMMVMAMVVAMVVVMVVVVVVTVVRSAHDMLGLAPYGDRAAT